MRLTAILFFVLCSLSISAQTYPANIFPDSSYAPFIHGVASGDPLQNKVIIWSRVETNKDEDVRWQIAADSSFQSIIQDGLVIAVSEHDYTIKIDVGGLQPGTTYYYRFQSSAGKFSQTGKAQTLPGNDCSHFKLAVVSCSSIWAGFFNAYRNIAYRSDIDFLVHLGDYVYDYPDERQLKRMPAEKVTDCAGLTDWRERHKYYLLDPDLRSARQHKTWIAEWDNHDTDVEAPGKTEEAIQAFYEYLPVRMPDSLHPEKIYRHFSFGKLADLMMMDMHLFRGKEEYAPGKKSVLGLEQHEWIKNTLQNSEATWKLLGNQEMMNDWLSEGAPKFIRRGNGRVFDESNWNGYPEDRQRLFDFIDTNHINNVVIMTGDIHMSFVMNTTGTPKDKNRYGKKTGASSIAVEFTTPSISRVNMQEAGVPGFLIPAVQNFSRRLNPHHVWCKFTQHGYATLDVISDKCSLEYCYVPISKITSTEKTGKSFSVIKNTNRWQK